MCHAAPPLLPRRGHARTGARRGIVRTRLVPEGDARGIGNMANVGLRDVGDGGDRKIRDGRRGAAGRVGGYRGPQLCRIPSRGRDAPGEDGWTLHIGK